MRQIFAKIKNLVQNPRYSSWVVFFIYFILAIIVIRSVLFTGQTIGLRHDWSIPENSQGIVNWVKEALYPWSEERGGMSIAYWSDIVLRFTIGLFGYLGLGGAFLSNFIIIFSIVLAGLGSYIFLRQITKSNLLASFIGSIVYVFNPLFFNKIISGHTYYLIAYALSPWFLYFFSQTFSITSIKNKPYWISIIMASLLFALCGAQTQFVILLLIFCFILFYIQKLNWHRFIINLIIISISTLLIHLSWLLTFFLSSIYYQNPISITPSTFSWFVYNSSQLYQSFFLVGGATDYLSRTLEQYYVFTPWLAAAGLLLIIVIFHLLTSAKNSVYQKYFFFFLVFILILSISRLVPELSFLIFKKSILFNIFREVYHAAWLVAITFSILVCLAVEKLFLLPNKIIKILTATSLLIFVSPFFIDGRLLNNLQTFQLDHDYLAEIDNNHRLLYLPSLQPLLADNLLYSGFDPNIYFSDPPSLSQISSYGSLSDRFNTFFQSQLYFNSKAVAPVLQQYLQLFDITDIIYRPHTKSDLVKYTLLSEYPTKIMDFQNSTLVKTLNYYTDKLVNQTDNWLHYQFDPTAKIINAPTCLTSGAWQNLNQIFTLSGAATCDGIFFAQDTNYQDVQTDNIIIANNNYLDYLLKNPANTVIEPGLWADQTMDPKENWVSAANIWWYNPYFASYAKMLAFTSSVNAELNIDLSSIDTGSYQILVESFPQPAGDKIQLVYHDWQQTIDNYSQNQGFVWQDLGLITIQDNSEKLTITNLGGSNAIGQIMLIPADDYENQISDFNQYLTEKNKIILLDPHEISQPTSLTFKLNDQAKFYANFPEYSSYEFEQNPDQISVQAKFTGPASQDEYATIIYSTKQFNLRHTPILSIYSTLENSGVQFWEMGLELDNNNDGQTDTFAWGRLKNGQNLVNLYDFISAANSKISPDNITIIAIRFQPHKEYNIDMNQLANKTYSFQLSDASFYSLSNEIIRPARTTNDIDINNLLAHPSHTLDFVNVTNLYNDFPDTSHEIDISPYRLKLDSTFSDNSESSEYATIIINTDIDLNFYPYFTADLEIKNPHLQFYDLSFGIDTNHDDQVDNHLWVDSIQYNADQLNKSVFYDLKNLLQQKTDYYQNPRLIQIEILPHKQYPIDSDIAPVEFTMSNFNFYHEAALQATQTDALPAPHYPITIPETGPYSLFININSQSKGQLFGSLNGHNFQVDVSTDSQNQWYKVGEYNLPAGENNLALITYDQKFTINNIALFKMDKTTPSNINQPTDITKINPAHYQANLELTQPGYIVFRESYHPAWYLNLIDKTTGDTVASPIRPTLINGWQQAYYINNPGSYQLDFQYSLTPVYRVSLVISLVFVISMMITLLTLSFLKR
ncbi:MAG: hypothetical protein WC570_02170 [Patescibacteria group bacterium]